MVVGSSASGRQPWEMLAWSIGFVLLLVIGFGTIIWLNDRFLQRFDLDWRSEARRWNRRKKRKGDRTGSDVTMQPIEIRRSAYVQLIATLPYILITLVIICLLSVANDPGVSTARVPTVGVPQAVKSDVSNSIVGTYLGTVVALLMTSCFALYIVKVIDRRENANEAETREQRRKRWFRGWEFLVIPLMAIVAVIYATATAESQQRDWGYLAVFMLLSCIAVAYGVIYRLFYDVDKLERERRRSLKLISDLRADEPADDVNDDDEISGLRDAVQRERRDFEELTGLRWTGHALWSTIRARE